MQLILFAPSVNSFLISPPIFPRYLGWEWEHHRGHQGRSKNKPWRPLGRDEKGYKSLFYSQAHDDEGAEDEQEKLDEINVESKGSLRF